MYLEYYIPNYKDYIGKTIGGVLITYSGIIAAAHLGGVGSVKYLLKNGHNATDGHESVLSFMAKFANFKIGLVV